VLPLVEAPAEVSLLMPAETPPMPTDAPVELEEPRPRPAACALIGRIKAGRIKAEARSRVRRGRFISFSIMSLTVSPSRIFFAVSTSENG
jgi:hypothetical protein